MQPFPSVQAGGGGAYTTWNPADKNASVVLSNGNMTADGTAAAQGVRGTTGKSSGKWGLVQTYSGGNIACCGIANSAMALNSGPASGGGNVIFVFDGNAQIALGSTNLGAAGGAPPGASTVVQWVFDFTNKLVWAKFDAGNWNNSGTADPVAGTGGYSFAAANAGPFYPYFCKDGAGAGAVILAPYSTILPAGIKPWDSQ